ncbi:hypothetical protein J6590_044816 [Homalodisca vitripennis]|nr:hypothetical protein J6590_044816 [Homalodisca vitripennis]
MRIQNSRKVKFWFEQQGVVVLPYIQPAAPKEHFDWAEKPQRNVFRISKSYLQRASSARNRDAPNRHMGDREGGRQG